jgi:hypothetical protein
MRYIALVLIILMLIVGNVICYHTNGRPLTIITHLLFAFLIVFQILRIRECQ